MSEMPDRINILPGEYPDSGYGARVYYGPKKPPGTTEYIRIPTSITDPVVVDGKDLDALTHALKILKDDYMGRHRESGSDCVVAIMEKAVTGLTRADGPVEP